MIELKLMIDGRQFGETIKTKKKEAALSIGKNYIEDALTHKVYGQDVKRAGYNIKTADGSHGKQVKL